MSKLIDSVILAEEVTSYFEDVIGGMYSDEAWYELLNYCYKEKTGEIEHKLLINHLEFIFGFEGDKDFEIVQKKANRRIKKLAKKGIL